MSARLSENVELNAEITGIATIGFEELRANTLADGTLNRLLKCEGKSDEIVPVLSARLIAIIAYLETLSNVRTAEDNFSPQEESFLKMMASIQGCPSGKSEGVNAYYLNILPSTFQFTRAVSSAEDDIAYLKSKAEVSTILAVEVEKMFSGQNHLMKALVGIDPRNEVQQASHQAGYLKNLIGRDVGLVDKVHFDAHTPVLYQGLVDGSKQEALEAFFTHLLPHGYIHLISQKYGLEAAGVIEMLTRMGIFVIED